MITLLVILAVVLVGVAVLAALLLPAAMTGVERVRIEREAQMASWRIHQRAVAAFAEMLHAAREEQ